jgi:hypothetical protein
MNKNKPTTDKVQRPETKKAPEHLNKMQIKKKFVASAGQEVDPQYDSDEDKEKTIDFDKEIQNIKNLKGVDLVFCIDTTGSMMPFMKSIKELMRKIIRDGENFVKQFEKSKDIFKIGIVAYRDHDDEKEKDSYLTKAQDFTDGNSARKFLNTLNAKGGFDKPEAVMDGLNEVLKLKWRDDSQKFLIHFLDGPPHGEEYGVDTKFPNGCPCNVGAEDIFYPMRDLNLKYSIIKLNDDIDSMCRVFQEFLELEIVKLDISYDQNEKKTQHY